MTQLRSTRLLLVVGLFVAVVTLVGGLGMATTAHPATGADSQAERAGHVLQDTSDGSLDDLELGLSQEDRSVEHKLTLYVDLDADEDETFTIDTSDLAEIGTVTGANVESEFDASVAFHGTNRTEIDVQPSANERQVGVVYVNLQSEKDTVLEETVTITVTGERSGDELSETQTIFDADQELSRLPSVSDRTEVFVRVYDPDGTQLTTEDVEVWAEDRGDAEFTITRGELFSDGRYLLRPEPNNPYDLRATAPGYGSDTIESVEFDDGGHDETLELMLEPGVSVSGTVTDETGAPVDGASVQAFDEQGQQVGTTTDADGSYELSVSPGQHALRAHTDDGVATIDGGVALNETDDAVTADFEMRTPAVLYTNVEHVGGTEPEMDEIEVRADASRGFMFVQLDDGTDPRDALTPTDLADYGADETTEFELTLTVEHYEPDSVLWAGDDVEWETEPSDAGEDTVDVTIRTSPAHLEFVDTAPFGPVTDADDVSWPVGDEDVADRNVEQGVQLATYESTHLVPEMQAFLRGMTATTNAQAFGLPTIDDGELSIYVGAPSERTDGTEHAGFYSVFVPDPLLEEWNVEDPESDLVVAFQGDEESFDVEVEDDGAWIHLDPLSYSDGEVTVQSTAAGEDDDGLIDQLDERMTILVVAGIVVLVAMLLASSVVVLRDR